MITEPEPRVTYCEDGSLLCEWIVGQQGGPQIRFSLSIDTDEKLTWVFVGRGELDFWGGGYVPQEFVDRIPIGDW